MAEIDMTKPQPCTKFEGAATVEWMAKLSEEANEVIQEAAQLERIAGDDYDDELADEQTREEVEATERRLALELTDVITVCTSWLHAIGYHALGRGVLQFEVNEKNKKRGYFGID